MFFWCPHYILHHYSLLDIRGIIYLFEPVTPEKSLEPVRWNTRKRQRFMKLDAVEGNGPVYLKHPNAFQALALRQLSRPDADRLTMALAHGPVYPKHPTAFQFTTSNMANHPGSSYASK